MREFYDTARLRLSADDDISTFAHFALRHEYTPPEEMVESLRPCVIFIALVSLGDAHSAHACRRCIACDRLSSRAVVSLAATATFTRPSTFCVKFIMLHHFICAGISFQYRGFIIHCSSLRFISTIWYQKLKQDGDLPCQRISRLIA